MANHTISQLFEWHREQAELEAHCRLLAQIIANSSSMDAWDALAQFAEERLGAQGAAQKIRECLEVLVSRNFPTRS